MEKKSFEVTKEFRLTVRKPNQKFLVDPLGQITSEQIVQKIYFGFISF